MGAASSVLDSSSQPREDRAAASPYRKATMMPLKQKTRARQSMYIKEKTTKKKQLLAQLLNESNSSNSSSSSSHSMGEETYRMLSSAMNDFFFAQMAGEEGGMSNKSAVLRTYLMMKALQREEFKAESTVITAGEHGEKLFLMESGEADVVVNDRAVRRLEPGALFGELALLCDEPRNATVKCVSDCVLWSLSRNMFHSVIEFVHADTAEMRKKWLSSCPELKSLQGSDMSKLLSSLETHSYKVGDKLQEKGAPMTQIFVIESGRVKIEGVVTVDSDDSYDSVLGIVQCDKYEGAFETHNLSKDNFISDQVVEERSKDSPDLGEGCIFSIGALKAAMHGSQEGIWKFNRSDGEASQEGEGRDDTETDGNVSILCPVELIAKSDVVCSAVSIKQVESLVRKLEKRSDSCGDLEDLEEDGETADRGVPSQGSSRSLFVKPGEINTSFIEYTSVLERNPGELILLGHSTKDDQYQCRITAVGKSHIMKNDLIERMKHLKECLSSLKSPGLLRFYGLCQTPTAILFIEEYLGHGDIWSLLYEISDDGRVLPENLIRFYICELVNILTYLHRKGISFRNIRSENVVFDVHGYLRLQDFRCAKKIPFYEKDDEGNTVYQQKSHTMCGAADYLSPEHIFCTGVDHGVDLWALGALIFEMILKRTPFNPTGDSSTQDIFARIAKTKVAGDSFCVALNGYPDFKSLVSKLMKPNAKSRLGYKRTKSILSHECFKDVDIAAIRNRSHLPEYVPHVDGPGSLADVCTYNDELNTYFEQNETFEDIEGL